MTIDKTQITNMTSRQKAMAGMGVLVVAVIIWQAMGLFGGGNNHKPQPTAMQNKHGQTTNGNGNQQVPGMPQPSQIAEQRMTPDQQNELVKLQQETQEKYVQALNQLQMLKLSQEIEETNKSIATAKLQTVTAEKGVVDLLSAPAPQEQPSPPAGTMGSMAMQPGIPSGALSKMSAQPPLPSQLENPSVNYLVISVSQLLNKWSAVLSYQGKLYSVFVGDIVPADQSTVVAIDKYSVILEKDGVQRKLSMVPLI